MIANVDENEKDQMTAILRRFIIYTHTHTREIERDQMKEFIEQIVGFVLQPRTHSNTLSFYTFWQLDACGRK